MELESYLELLDKYECSEWVVRHVLGGTFAMILFIIILLTFCVNFTIYFVDFIREKKEHNNVESDKGE